MLKINEMARPIKETPILKGKEAAIFLAKMEKSKTQKISEAERERMNKNYETLKAIACFS